MRLFKNTAIFFLLLSGLFFSSTQVCADTNNIETIVVQKEYSEADFARFKNLKGIHIFIKNANDVDCTGILLPFLNCPLTDTVTQQISKILANSYKNYKKITIKTIVRESVLLCLVQEEQEVLVTDPLSQENSNSIDKKEQNEGNLLPGVPEPKMPSNNSESKEEALPSENFAKHSDTIDELSEKNSHATETNLIKNDLAEVPNEVQDTINVSPNFEELDRQTELPNKVIEESQNSNSVEKTESSSVQENLVPPQSVENPVKDNTVPPKGVESSVQENLVPPQSVEKPIQDESQEPAQSSEDSGNIPNNITPETSEKLEKPVGDEIENNNAVESWRAEEPEEKQDKAVEAPNKEPDQQSESQETPDLKVEEMQNKDAIESVVPQKEPEKKPGEAIKDTSEIEQATQNNEEEPVVVSEKDFPRLPEPPPAPVTEPKVEKYSFHAIILTGSNQVFDRGLTQAKGIAFIDLKIPGEFDKLRQKLMPFLNKPLGPDELLSLKQIIIDYYQEQKHPLVSVQIPSQNVTNGILRVLVIEGHLGGYSFSGNEWFSTKLLSKYVRLKKGEVIDEIRLIEDLNLMNRNPFRRVDVVYSPGEESRTTNVEFLVKDRFPLRPYAGAENNGIETIGRQRWFAGVNWGNAFGADQLLSYQCTASYDFKKFQAHTGQYMVPLPWRDILLLYGGYSWVDVHIPNLPTAKSKGHSMQASARYLLPLRPTKTLMHDLIFGFDFKRLNSTVEFSAEHPIFDGNINLSQFVLGYNWNLEYSLVKSSFDINLFYSPGKMLPDQSDKDFDTFRPFAKSDYLYGLASWATLITGKAGSLSVFLKGQFAGRNLIASEEFGLGGYDTVRGYEEHIYNGDNGFLLRTEIATPPFSILNHIWCKAHDSLKFLGFLDYGWANVHKDSSNSDQFGPSHEYLMGAGPGLRYVINTYVSLRFDCGFKLHKNDFLGHKEKMYHFSITVGY